MCHTFLKYAEIQERLNPSSMEIGIKFGYPDLSVKFSYMSEELAGLSRDGYSSETMSKLLDYDMECRKLWAIAYGGSDLKYNSKFNPK